MLKGISSVICLICLLSTMEACRRMNSKVSNESAQSSDQCTSSLQQLINSPSDLQAALEEDFSNIESVCFGGRDVLSGVDETPPTPEAIRSGLDLMAGGPDSSNPSDLAAASPTASSAPADQSFALAGQEVRCSQPSDDDPTGCLEIHVRWAGLQAAVDAELRRNPLINSANDNLTQLRRATMVSMIGGVSNIVVDITVPHCDRASNTCRIRARASGNSPSGRWRTGACYETEAQKAADANFGAHVCADGLRCEGYRAGSFFSRPTYGTCRVVDQSVYERYFRFVRPANPSSQPSVPEVTPTFEPLTLSCSAFKAQMVRWLGSETNPGPLAVAGQPNASTTAVCRAALGDPQYRYGGYLGDGRCLSALSPMEDGLRPLAQSSMTNALATCAGADQEFRDLLGRARPAYVAFSRLNFEPADTSTP